MTTTSPDREVLLTISERMRHAVSILTDIEDRIFELAITVEHSDEPSPAEGSTPGNPHDDAIVDTGDDWVQPVLQDLAEKLEYWAGRVGEFSTFAPNDHELAALSAVLLDARNAAYRPLPTVKQIARALHADDVANEFQNTKWKDLPLDVAAWYKANARAVLALLKGQP
jgi:hypothetical protein